METWLEPGSQTWSCRCCRVFSVFSRTHRTSAVREFIRRGAGTGGVGMENLRFWIFLAATYAVSGRLSCFFGLKNMCPTENKLVLFEEIYLLGLFFEETKRYQHHIPIYSCMLSDLLCYHSLEVIWHFVVTKSVEPFTAFTWLTHWMNGYINTFNNQFYTYFAHQLWHKLIRWCDFLSLC